MDPKTEIQDKAYEYSKIYKHLALSWAPGCGKTGAAFKIADNYKKVLVVLSKKVHKDNWLKEAKDRGYDISRYKFICYPSLKKVNPLDYDLYIFDEAHTYNVKNFITTNPVLFLSGSLSIDFKAELKTYYPDLINYSISLTEAQSLGILPNFKIKLIGLPLSTSTTFIYNRNMRFPGIVPGCPVIKYPGKLRVICDVLTQEYYAYGLMVSDLSTCMALGFYKIAQMHIGNQLQRLYNQVKINALNGKIDLDRTIVFVDKEKTAIGLGLKDRVVFNNKKSATLIDDFNNGKVNSLASIHMLKESINLKNVKKCVILYATKHYSKTGSISLIQQIGRALRSTDTEIEIYYVKDTKDEDNIKKLLQINGLSIYT